MINLLVGVGLPDDPLGNAAISPRLRIRARCYRRDVEDAVPYEL